MIDLDSFIHKYILERPTSLFQEDLDNHSDYIRNEVSNKSILVIGGAGTIGAAFIKEIIKFNPAKITVVDHNENGLTELIRDLRSGILEKFIKDFTTYPFDYGSSTFKKLLSNSHFHIVANFAAHKHVRSEKDLYSIEAMLYNNVFNNYDLLNALVHEPPDHFFSVSTDKASRPINVMGASKQLMEEVIFSFSDQLKVTTARFANVAFSNGSLLFGIDQRIAKNQPLSIPLDVKRYFVSPKESGQLCLLACIIGKKHEILFPKLETNQAKNFADITIKYLQALGFETESCHSEEEARLKMKFFEPKSKKYPVFFFKTKTSGEKLIEEFYSLADQVDLTTFKSLGIINKKIKTRKVLIQKHLSELKDHLTKIKSDKSELIRILEKYIDGFNHHETGLSLDQKM